MGPPLVSCGKRYEEEVGEIMWMKKMIREENNGDEEDDRDEENERDEKDRGVRERLKR